ncbi:MAG TPA: DUF4445 domain-containing protein [Papillibacter sp.]|nr:DUF4445 domain-containing protein [Papillibacter sp.]
MAELKIYRAGKLLTAYNATVGTTLYNAIREAGVPFEAPCGGRGKCGKCLVRLTPDGPWVKACETTLEGDGEVYLPDALAMKIAGDAEGAAAKPASTQLGIAVDIGTTTVVCHLLDLNSCEKLATASNVNAQRTFGADVISRIQYCAENGHSMLTQLIQNQLKELILQACNKAGADPKNIRRISLAGNTIMQHLAADMSPVGMGVAPFTPLSLFGFEVPNNGLYPIAEDAVIYYAPCVYSYVGGDITVGMLASGLENMDGPCVYIDIGTNGEIALKANGRYYCCATAAGPAFEGAEIAKGMAAVPGAISHVTWGENGLELTILGDNVPPEGLCGSGLMDALAVLVETGAVDETGRLVDAEELPGHPIAKHLGKREGLSVFWLSEEHDVYMIPRDVRKLQLAKAAIAAGIQTLLQTAGISEEDVASFIIAGGFGSFLDKTSTAKVGLFPKRFLPFAKSLGNMAGEGAVLALCSEQARRDIQNIMDNFEVVELSTSPIFNEQFVEQMMFDNE